MYQPHQEHTRRPLQCTGSAAVINIARCHGVCCQGISAPVVTHSLGHRPQSRHPHESLMVHGHTFCIAIDSHTNCHQNTGCTYINRFAKGGVSLPDAGGDPPHPPCCCNFPQQYPPLSCLTQPTSISRHVLLSFITPTTFALWPCKQCVLTLFLSSVAFTLPRHLWPVFSLAGGDPPHPPWSPSNATCVHHGMKHMF